MELNKVEIDIDDFKIMKILISERFCELNCKIGTDKQDQVDLGAYEILKKMYYKYCDNK